MKAHDFEDFDRELTDLRSAVATANTTMHDSVKRYIAMMDALEAAFTLHYGKLPEENKAEMRTAFGKLQEAFSMWTDDSPPTGANQ
jgi:hypothetical protein